MKRLGTRLKLNRNDINTIVGSSTAAENGLQDTLEPWTDENPNDTYADRFFHLCAESQGWINEFWGTAITIDSDNETVILENPSTFNWPLAIDVILKYLGFHDDPHPDAPHDGSISPEQIGRILDPLENELLIKEVLRWNDFTRHDRGADDGTFDYAGTFVITILETLSLAVETLDSTYRRLKSVWTPTDNPYLVWIFGSADNFDRFQHQMTYPFDELHINDVLTTIADPDWFIGR